MNKTKKLLSFLSSMQFAFILLGILAAVCIAGSLIPQGEVAAVYQQSYPAMSGLLLALDFDDVFHAWWFVLLTAALCVNLCLCNLFHFPKLMKKMRQERSQCPASGGTCIQGEPQGLFQDMGFRKTEAYEGDGLYAIRNRIGLWGAWLTHLGIFIVILGFALGQMFTQKSTVYGVPGTEKPVENTAYTLKIEDFDILLREDDTVEQYVSVLTLTDSRTGQTWTGETSVNYPLDMQGMRFYQNSTGWAADVAVLKGDEPLQVQTLCAGEYLTVADNPDLVILLRSVYPDYVKNPDGSHGTASGNLNNPAYLYMLYYKEELLGMNVLMADEKITISDYSVIIANPQSYSLIQIKRDPFTWLAGIGAAVLLLALVVAFYLRTEELWAIPNGDGTWTVYGRSRKGSLLYQEKLLAAAENYQKEATA